MFFFKKTSEKRKSTALSPFSLNGNDNNYQKKKQKNIPSCCLQKSVSEPSPSLIMKEHKNFSTEKCTPAPYERVLFDYEIDKVNGEPVTFSLQEGIQPYYGE